LEYVDLNVRIILKIYLKGVWWEDKDYWWALVNKIISLRVQENEGNMFIRRATLSS
jgi:hypothetical protein